MLTRLDRLIVVVVVATAVGMAALTGCGSDARSTTTSAQAHRQIVHYLQATADSLPAGTRLSTTLPWGPSQGFSSPGQLPGNLDDDNPEQPYSYYSAMWVLLPDASEGSPLGSTAQNILIKNWRAGLFD